MKKIIRFLIVIVLCLIVVAAHVLLAPVTTRYRTLAENKYRLWQSGNLAEQFTMEAKKTKLPARADAVEAVKSLDKWLNARGRKLTVVLLATSSSLMDKKGGVLTAPATSAKKLQAFSDAIQKEGVACINLLTPTYREVSYDSKGAFKDELHFDDPLEAKMATELIRGQSLGKDSMFIGDCFASIMSSAVMKQDPDVQIRTFWKGLSTYAMAYEVSKIDEHELDGVKNVYWMLADFALNYADYQFPLCSTSHAPKEEGVQIKYAAITQNTEVSPTIDKDSPYEDALAVHKFKAQDGSDFLGIVPVMTKRKINALVRRWEPKSDRFRLTLVDWDAATAKDTKLRNIQMIDDIQDFELPRYYITEWMSAVTLPPAVK